MLAHVLAFLLGVVIAVVAIPLFFLAGLYLTVKIGDWTKRSVFKLQDDVLMTAVQYYRHHQTGKVAVLVGMIHVAEKAHFRAIEKLVEEKETRGYGILHEGVSKYQAPRRGKKKKGVAGRQIQDWLTGLSVSYRYQAITLDLVLQSEELHYQPSWHRTDLTDREIGDALKSVGYRFPEPIGPVDIKPGDAKAKFDLDQRYRKVQFYSLLADLALLIDRNSRLENGVVIKLRDEVAFQGIVRYLDIYPGVVSMWGAGHLPGISKKLKRSGFVLEKVEWLPAYYPKKNIPLFDQEQILGYVMAMMSQNNKN